MAELIVKPSELGAIVSEDVGCPAGRQIDTSVGKSKTAVSDNRSSVKTITAGHSYTITLVSHDENNPGDATDTTYDDVATS